MSQSLTIDRKESDNVVILTLSGSITEDSQIEEAGKNPKPFVVINLEQVQRINSYGIRQWINVMKDISKTATQLVFVKAPPAFVEQFNMISNFGGGGFVYSFFLPYYCESCDQERLVLFELKGEVSPENLPTVPAEKCPKCAKPLMFNDIEEEYFCFMEHQKGRKIDPRVVQAIQQG